jgi:glutaredoxin 3
VNKVLMYSQQVCSYCDRAERLLQSRGVGEIEKIMIDRDAGQRAQMMSRTGRRTVPQIYIGEMHVGGFDDLVALDRGGGLVPLLEGSDGGQELSVSRNTG